MHKPPIDIEQRNDSPQSSNIRDCELVIMGMFPPPVTGAAKNLLLMHDEMARRGVRTAIVDTGIHTSALSRSIGYHRKRVSHFFRQRAKMEAIASSAGRAPVLYCVPDGGLGLWYTYGYLRSAVGRVRRTVLHHRTFQYIDKPSEAMRRICKLRDLEIIHVFLSSGMAAQFQKEYGSVTSLVSTNARYVTPRRPAKSTGALVIGHLSNLCTEKGFFDVADTFEAVSMQGISARLEIAGPILEPSIETRLIQLTDKYGEAVKYHGPLSGAAKDAFYDGIDIFLFPTRWKQEAQPNVVYEAYAGGARVIAYGRGCIPEQLDMPDGHSIDIDSAFPEAAVKVISQWSAASNRDEAAARIAEHLEIERTRSVSQYEQLLQILT